MYRVWYSTEGFADYIIENTILKKERHLLKSKLYESDANNPRRFHTMPDHIRKILYLDAPDIIVEKDKDPIFSIEISKEAGTGQNPFQRFARIAASVENNVPAIYIYPEAVIVGRKESTCRWDKINPLIFKALNDVMRIYKIPALLYYFPSDYRACPNNPKESLNFKSKGLRLEKKVCFADCPDSNDSNMKNLFKCINEIIRVVEEKGLVDGRQDLLSNLVIRQQMDYNDREYYSKSANASPDEMSPLSATVTIPTKYLINYLSQYNTKNYTIGELLNSREETVLYQVDAKFRGDPYSGALSAIDYLKCREKKTFEDRRRNLVLVFGKITVDKNNKTIVVTNTEGASIKDFFEAVQSCKERDLLGKNYEDLRAQDIPRYLMQVRYGSTYSKVKHIRVYSYFSDAILFPDGSLWRDN